MTPDILIVYDQPIVCQGLVALISKQPDLKICGEARSAAEAYELVEATRPMLVIVELSLQDGDGLALIKDLARRSRTMKLLAIGTDDEPLTAEGALRAGAAGYVSQRDACRTIIQAIHAVLNGEVFLSEAMKGRVLLQAFGANASPARSPAETLSHRELEVFGMLGHGFTSREVAAKLELSQRTVDAHREHIKEKLKLRNSAELVAHAVQWVLEAR
jgi:DNA-binding NarL/FixJ family response regulator